MFKAFLANNKTSINKSNYIWNIIAYSLNACESVVLIATVSRVIGIDYAGIITIAFAISNLLLNVGKYSIRGFQTTDAKNQFEFKTYFSFRVITVSIMIISLLAFTGFKILIGEYNPEKAIIIILLCLIYAVEAMEDVFLGHYQFLNRLDIASKVFSIRWIAIFIVFCLSMVVQHNLILSLLLSLIISVVLDCILLFDANRLLKIKDISFRGRKIKELAIHCFPLFASAFLFFYVTTAPKLSIDKFLTEKEQACFGVISMPIFIVDLLSNFLYQPQIVKMSEEWKTNNIKSFLKRIIVQILFITALTICCILFANTFGCNLLSLIFNIDISSYRLEFTLLMLASGEFALLAYSSMILAIMRKQLIHFIGISVIAILALIGFNIITLRYGIIGITIYYAVLIAIPTVTNLFSTAILILTRHKHTK